MKRLRFLGRSHDDLRAFPQKARGEAGRQLKRVQEGAEPDDWKPMKSIGAGVAEIRVAEAAGAFRVIYIARFEEAVYVLHCFQKKQQKTSGHDIDLATARYRSLLRGRLHD